MKVYCSISFIYIEKATKYENVKRNYEFFFQILVAFLKSCLLLLAT